MDSLFFLSFSLSLSLSLSLSPKPYHKAGRLQGKLCEMTAAPVTTATAGRSPRRQSGAAWKQMEAQSRMSAARIQRGSTSETPGRSHLRLYFEMEALKIPDLACRCVCARARACVRVCVCACVCVHSSFDAPALGATS